MSILEILEKRADDGATELHVSREEAAAIVDNFYSMNRFHKHSRRDIQRMLREGQLMAFGKPLRVNG